MKHINSLLDKLKDGIFSSTYQLQRIVILTGVALTLAVISFGGYYYYDRYYHPQPKTADVMLQQAEKALRDKPNDPNVRLNLAETYMVNKRFDEAITIADQVMKAYPDNQRAWFVTGVANALKGNPANAIDPLKKYVDANKDSDMPGLNKSLQAATYYLGDSYLRLGQPDKAIEPLELDVKWSQTDADAMYKLGVAYSGVKKYEEAVSMFQSATVFVPNFTEAYEGMASDFEALKDQNYANYAHGMVAYSKKDYKTALVLLLTAVQAKPDFAPVYEGLGLTYEAMGELKNAKSNYEVAIKLNPNSFTGSSGLKSVESLLKE